MKSDEPTHADAEALHPLHPLVRTLPAALVAHLFFVFLCLLSSLLFIYQFWFEPDYRAWYDVGEDAYPVDDPLAKAHVLGHLVRAVIGAILAWTSFRYLSSIRAIRRNANDAQQKFFAAIRTWWTSFATSAALGIAFGVWVMFGSFAAQHELTEFERFPVKSVPAVSVEFRLAEFEPGPGLSEAVMRADEEPIWLHPHPLITNEHIAESAAVLDPDGYPAISVKFTAEGATRIDKATAEHMNRPLAIIIDGRVHSAPVIQWRISTSAIITGLDSMEEAIRIARELSGQAQEHSTPQ